jgi:hypothetical protein
MKYILTLLLIPLFSGSECGKHKVKTGESYQQDLDTLPPGMPLCIKKIINNGNKQSPPDVPLEINEYLYQGKKVYLFSAPCCDQFNMLYDENCNVLCAPSGGFTGRGDGKCRDFDSTAKLVKLIWKIPSK